MMTFNSCELFSMQYIREVKTRWLKRSLNSTQGQRRRSIDQIRFPIIRPHHRTTYVDAACCYRPSSVVCRSVTLVSPAKTAEQIEMPFGI